MENKNCRFGLEAFKGHKLKDGSYPVMLYLKKERKRKIITTQLTALPEHWNTEAQCFYLKENQKVRRKGVEFDTKLHPDRKVNNDWLEKKKVECGKIIKDFDEAHIDWTLNQFEEKFLNITKKTGVEAYFNKHIESLRASGHIGNMRCYEQCLHILKEHDSKFSAKVFPEIDIKYIEGLHKYLHNDRGCKINTIRYYMKAFRALINKAIKDGEASEATYPFGKNGYQIKGQKTAKRYLTSGEIEELKTRVIPEFHLNLYRNIFLFSYHCQGMAFVDVASLTKANIEKMEYGYYIVYKRKKTEGKNTDEIPIKITDHTRALLDWFKSSTPLIGDYLVPVVSKPGLEGEVLYQHIRDRLHRYNKNLKTVATTLGIERDRLSGYWSRHSYAMRLKNTGVATDIISQALGHKDLKTTMTYLAAFAPETVDNANKNL